MEKVELNDVHIILILKDELIYLKLVSYYTNNAHELIYVSFALACYEKNFQYFHSYPSK